MIERDSYDLNSIVEMKKAHPCQKKNKLFQITRLGADIKIKCLSCSNVIMMSRLDFESKAKKIIKK